MATVRPRIAALSALVALLTGWSCEARAQVDDAHDGAVAEFTLGRVRFEAGDCAGAIPHFVKSLELEQNVGARFNLAVCSAREGHSAEAWNHYKAAEQLAIAKKDAKRVELAHGAAADLDRKVVKVRVVLPREKVATVTLDGRLVPATDHWMLGTAYALEPAVAHTFVVEIPGQKRWTRPDVRGDAGVELPAIVVDVERPKETIVIQERTVTPPLRTASYVVGAVGVSALAASGIFAILAASSRSDAKSACESGTGYAYPSACNPTRRDEVDPANDSAQAKAAVATGMAIAGGVLVTGAVAMYLLSRPTTTRIPNTSIGFAPVFGGAVMSGSF